MITTNTNIIKEYIKNNSKINYFFEFFNDIAPDENGLYKGLILHHNQCLFLWGISWLSLGSGLFAIYRGYYDLSIVPLGVWLTSINYWRSPDYSWRRYLDIGYVHSALMYQSIRAYRSEYCNAYFTILSFGIICFPISIYFHKKSPWTSTILHGMVHIFGNISNIVLYSGKVVKVTES